LEWCINPFSFHFNGRFPGGPGLAGTTMSSFCLLLVEVMVTTGAVRRAVLQSSITTNKPTQLILITLL